MKKVKNTESKINNTSMEKVKEGKVKKNKPIKEKKLKDAAAKTENLNLAPKIESTNLKPSNNVAGGADKTEKKNKNKKNKPAKTQENPKTSTETSQQVANDKKPKEEKPAKKNMNKEKKSKPETTATPTKDLTEEELKKVEKKKAKKLAQKLKKQQNKVENRTEKVKTTVPPTTNGQKKLKAATNKKNAATSKKNVTSNKDTTSNKDATNNKDATSNKVLSKKERKAERRQLIKEKKKAAKQNRDPAQEAATVFVGNLPVNTKRVQLIRLFKDYGPVNSIRLRSAGGEVLYKHKQRVSAGALNAYVVLKSKEIAEKATTLNGVEFKDHHLRITLAAKNPQSHEKEQSKKTVFVGNLKYTATEESLREIFSSCGEIDYVRCIRDGDKGCKGVAYVCFKTADAVGLALELNQTIVDERPINVERYSVRKLGAKEARDAQAEKEEKSNKGAKKRIDGKKGGKKDKKPSSSKGGHRDEPKKPKKSEFRGVKVEGLKKKPKTKKKKSNDQMQLLAKKIAPKAKTE